MRVMSIQAVVFDIGGVFEITPSLAVTENWESRLGLGSGEINERMADVWEAGSIGMISEHDVQQAVGERLGLDERQADEFMGWIWREYLGTANTELIEYECGMSKPDPRIYALTCERLRVEPAQMVFLDNHVPYVEGARQAGIHALLYRDNSQAIRDIEDLVAR